MNNKKDIIRNRKKNSDKTRYKNEIEINFLNVKAMTIILPLFPTVKFIKGNIVPISEAQTC